jgi:hypothetical protein
VNHSFRASVVASSAQSDLAVLKLEIEPHLFEAGHQLPFIKLAVECIPGSMAFCGGFAIDGNFHIADGIVTNTDDPHRIVITDITDSGLSGGPCVGRAYRGLFGVVQRDFGHTQHRTAVIPLLDVDNFLRLFPDIPQIQVYRP